MKKILFLFLLFSIVGQVFGQRKTTSVKGYYKKNGTYVSPHTRSYNSGSSSYSSSSYSSNFKGEASEVNIPQTTLTLATIDNSEYSNTTSKSKFQKGTKIATTTLKIEEQENITSIAENTEKSKIENSDGIVIYVSVLRYNDKTLDICPITRNYSGDWDFNKVQHRFLKNSITAEEALQLVSDYGWSINGDELKKDFSYDYISSKGLPKYLTKTVEAMKLK